MDVFLCPQEMCQCQTRKFFPGVKHMGIKQEWNKDWYTELRYFLTCINIYVVKYAQFYHLVQSNSISNLGLNVLYPNALFEQFLFVDGGRRAQNQKGKTYILYNMAPTLLLILLHFLSLFLFKQHLHTFTPSRNWNLHRMFPSFMRLHGGLNISLYTRKGFAAKRCGDLIPWCAYSAGVWKWVDVEVRSGAQDFSFLRIVSRITSRCV